ncbi:unnamed protein product [Meganyctiphanes norvegica]|uniref:Aldose 1-epimerase n=1 Tax=Meganyctiphanes norvegica TaxID=48144 RepID=A0AAV2Q5F8_MEGNR
MIEMGSISNIKEDIFGTFIDPETKLKSSVRRFTLSSECGIEVKVMSYGAGICDIIAPDKNGDKDHIIFGFENFNDYTKQSSYIGASIGRHFDRIGGGKFHLNGRDHQVTVNNFGNHVHGGTRGWDKYNWDAALVDSKSVVFSHVSPAGDQGYPGDVLAQVKYTLGADGALQIDYTAMATHATPINMSDHCLFNLAGHAAGREAMMEHVFQVNADTYLPITETVVPTGEVESLQNTALDFRSTVVLGKVIDKIPSPGLSHCFCLRNSKRGDMGFAARIQHPSSGRVLEIYTTEPGLQLYSGYFLPKEDNQLVGFNGSSYKYQSAFCSLGQNYGDAVNKPHFPQSILHPGKIYKHSMIYKFMVQE